MFGKVVAAGVASVALCGVAVAADMPAKAPLLTNATPVSQWDGFYVGVHGGYASGDANATAIITNSGSPKGGFGGFQIGYNYLVAPHWLIGAEIDASFGDVNADTTPVLSSNVKVDAFGTARGRVGYVQGPWLLYATAGTAWAKPDWNLAGVFVNERPLIGWTAGLGAEYAFAPNWSAKIEYLYADFDHARRNFFGTVVDTDLTMNMVRVGLNYRFGTFGNVAQASAVKAPLRTAARWTGPYIGVHGGYGSGDFRSTSFGQTSLDPDGGFGGIQTGYNWQFAPSWVIGLETDASWGSLKDSGAVDRIEIDAIGTARGRFGYAINNVLLYGTGGLAWAHLDSTTSGGFVISDNYMLGWTAGAGVEYQFASSWSAKVEYAYTDYGKVRETSLGTTLDEKLDAHTVKIGLNYQASLFGLLFSR